MEITRLEDLIINLAEHCDVQIRGYAGRAMNGQDEFDIQSAFIKGTTLTQLAMMANSGLTQAASDRLKKLHEQIARSMSAVSGQQESFSSALQCAEAAQTRH